MTDAFDPKGFTALSVIVTDSEGRMLDALQDSVADHPGLLEDGCFSAWKALAPYITEEMGQNAIFEVTGYKKRKKPLTNLDDYVMIAPVN